MYLEKAVDAKNGSLLIFHFLICTFCVLFFWFFFYVKGGLWVKPGDLAGSDGYMRLVRVIQLHETGDWFDTVSHRSNAPFGETLHWTRPLDVLLLLGAWVLTPFLGFSKALFWWAVMVSPFLMVLTVGALMWASRPILDPKGLVYQAYIFLFQIFVILLFQAGRPDHHSLLLFVFVISFGYILRLMLQPFRPGLCVAAGAVSAFSMWISVESLLPLAVNLATLSLMWVGVRGDFSRKNFYFCLSLLGATFLALLLERPWPELFNVEFDRLSVFHLVLFGLLALIFMVFQRLDVSTHFGSRAGRRFAVLAGGGIFSLIVLWLVFPKFFLGPFADVDPRIIPIWLSKVGEVAPIIDSNEGLTRFAVTLLIPAVAGMVIAIYLTLRDRRGAYQPWLYIFFSILVFTVLTRQQTRWISYAEILYAVVLAELLCMGLNKLDPYLTKNARVVSRFAIVAFFCLVIFLLDSLIRPLFPNEKKKLPLNVPLAGLCHYLNSLNRENHPKRILAHIFSGPEILYRTNHEVIGTPYHRNASGILYTFDVMTAPTDEEARRLLKERKIDLIILCLKTNESEIYASAGADSTFYQRLRQGKAPGWLRPVKLPADLSASFQVFQVLPEHASSPKTIHEKLNMTKPFQKISLHPPFFS